MQSTSSDDDMGGCSSSTVKYSVGAASPRFNDVANEPAAEKSPSKNEKHLKETILDAQVTVQSMPKPKEFDASASRTRPTRRKQRKQRMSCFSDMVTAGGVDNYYKLGETLGSGQYGFVVRATHKTTGREVCCKTIAKRALDDDDIDAVRREIQIMKFLDGHPNVIKLDEVFEDACNIHIIMELLSGGDLMKRASASGRFSEKVAAKIFQGILVGLTHAHEYGVMHRDLKLENVLLKDESDDSWPVLVDFGVSTWFKPGQILRETVGSPLYVAPEVLKQNYNCEADLWSAGVMLYIMLSGSLPFQGESDNDVYKAILLGEYDLTSDPWPTISASAKDLVSHLLLVDPKQRLTSVQALEHPWVAMASENSDHPLSDSVIMRLKKHSKQTSFLKVGRTLIARSLAPSELEGLKQLFALFDVGKAGRITIGQLELGLRKLGYAILSSQVSELVASLDLSEADAINSEEFIAALLPSSIAASEEKIWEAFSKFDEDGDGFITIKELEKLLEKQGFKGNAESMMQEVDTNNDGMINFDEFAHHFGKQALSIEPAQNTRRKSIAPVSVALLLETEKALSPDV